MCSCVIVLRPSELECQTAQLIQLVFMMEVYVLRSFHVPCILFQLTFPPVCDILKLVSAGVGLGLGVRLVHVLLYGVYLTEENSCEQ